MEIAIFIGVALLAQKIFNKFKISVSYKTISLVLLVVSAIALSLLALALFSLQTGKYSTGNSIISLPIIIALLCCYSIYFIIKHRGTQENVEEQTQSLSIGNNFISCIPIIFLVFSKHSFLFPIYVPHALKLESQSPGMAVGAYLVLTTLFAISVVYISKKIKSKFALSMATICLIISIYQSSIYSLSLLYGLITKYKVSYTFHGSIMSLSFIPIMVALLVVTFEKTNKINA